MLNHVKSLIKLLAVLTVAVLMLGTFAADTPKHYQYCFNFVDLYQKTYPNELENVHMLINCNSTYPAIRYNIDLNYDPATKSFSAVPDSEGDVMFRVRYYRTNLTAYLKDSDWIKAEIAPASVTATPLPGEQQGKYRVMARMSEKLEGKSLSCSTSRLFETVARYDDKNGKVMMGKWVESSESKEQKAHDYRFSFVELWQRKHVPAPPKDAYLLLNCNQTTPEIRYNIGLRYDSAEKLPACIVNANGNPKFRIRYYRPEKMEFLGDSGWMEATVDIGRDITDWGNGTYDIKATTIEKVFGESGQFFQARQFTTKAGYDKETNRLTAGKWVETAADQKIKAQTGHLSGQSK